MENKAPVLWDGSIELPKAGLRPPNIPSSVLLSQESKASANETQTQGSSSFSGLNQHHSSVKSSFNVNAPEFYPSSYHTTPTTLLANAGGSIQDRLKKHKVTETSAVDTSGDMDDFAGSVDDKRLKHLIETLTKDPEQFINLLDIFMDTLAPYFGNVLVLSRAAQLLVEQAITYPSFRHTGARICHCIEQHCPEFRASLHLTCQKELKNNPNKAGLLLFVAELYTQLHHENIYGNYLIDAYQHLLEIGGAENIKSICQALKLTGYSLEMYSKKALDDVFIKLNGIKPTVTDTVLCLINSVINLRSSNWGHESSINASTEPQEENEFWNDAPNTVFYNLDGSIFTNEEREFLTANMISQEDDSTDMSDPDELCDPEPEMDEEIRAAFKDFVKLSKR